MSPADRMEGALTADPNQKPAARIGGACFVCRAKKRKCSGEKPICGQCRDSKLRCEWPRQQKRGLPKHHVRKLEARLRRTETLLRSLLHFVSDEELESSLRDVAPMASMRGAQDKENADPGVWQSYPLTTLEDVRAWQSRTAGPGLPEVPPTAHASDPNEDAPVYDDSVPSQRGGSSRQSDHSPCPTHAAAASPGARTQTSQVDHFRGNAHPQSGRTSCGVSHTLLDSRVAEMTGADEPSTGARTFLPADFQREFLW